MNRPAELNERGLRELGHLLAEQLGEHALKQFFDDMSIEISEYLSKTGEPIFYKFDADHFY